LLNRETWDDRTRRSQLRDFLSNSILLLRDGRLVVPSSMDGQKRKPFPHT
jgi:hypothetical protein